LTIGGGSNRSEGTPQQGGETWGYKGKTREAGKYVDNGSTSTQRGEEYRMKKRESPITFCGETRGRKHEEMRGNNGRQGGPGGTAKNFAIGLSPLGEGVETKIETFERRGNHSK